MNEVLLDRPGMLVTKTDRHTVIKKARDAISRRGIHNSWRLLQAMSGTGYAPEPIRLEDDEIEFEFIDAQTEPLEGELLRENAIRCIFELRRRHICHLDAGGSNVIFRNNAPVLIDWDQSCFSWEKKPQKIPPVDTVMLYSVIKWHIDIYHVLERYRWVQRATMPWWGWGTLLDIGTYRGDFCALAQSDFLQSHGIDIDSFDTGGIQKAIERWGPYGCTFEKRDVLDVDTFDYNIVLFFSTFHHLVKQHGLSCGLDLLRKLVKDCDLLLFETEVYFEGMEDIPSNAALGELLSTFGAVSELGRHTGPLGQERVVWSVQ